MLDKIEELPSPEKEAVKSEIFIKRDKENFVKRVGYVADQVENKECNILQDAEDVPIIVNSLASLGDVVRFSWHRIAKQQDEYISADADQMFTEALELKKYKTPAKFFQIASNYGLEIKFPKTIAEKKDTLTLTDIIGNEEDAQMQWEFGFYEQDGMYHSADMKGKIQKISNFTMKIIYHIETSAEEAYRLVHLKNTFGFKRTVLMNTDDFVSVGSFKKMIARRGNFIFKGNDSDLGRLQDKLQRDEIKTEMVNQLGYQKKYNMYVWANGIYDCHLSKFTPVDDVGIVQHYRIIKDGTMEPINFFIPAMSQMFFDKDEMYVNEKRFLLVENPFTFEQWSRLFVKVYGDNGKKGLIYSVMAIFSDIIFEDIGGRFPMLNIYGQKGTGKGVLAESLMKLFGKGQKQFMLSGASTVVGFMRKSGQFSNGLLWMDEYKNNMKHDRIESLKNLYDRIGYERGKKDNSLATESTRVDSAVIVSGQEMPIVEDALFSRFLFIVVTKPIKTEESIKLYRELKKMEANGLSNITVYLLKHRKFIKDNFEKTYIEEQNELSKMVNNSEVDERFINNYSAMIAACTLLSKVETLPFNVKDFREICKNSLLEQYFVIKGSDSVGKFWSIIEYLFQEGWIQENKQFQVKEGKLFFRLQDVYQAYSDAMSKRKDPNVMDEQTLKNYLENDPRAFIERKKTWFNGSQRWCLIFKYDALGIDLLKAETEAELEDKYKLAGLVYTKSGEGNTNKAKPVQIEMSIPEINTSQNDSAWPV